MNLVLLSKGLGCLKENLNSGAKILFIPNAGDVYENPYFVRDAFEGLQALGFQVEECNLLDSSVSFEEKLSDDIDALFVAGGNVFYLLSLWKKTGFDEVVKKRIESGKTYIGSSAGAVILGPSLEPITTLDDPNAAPDLTSYEALCIIDPVILPHYGSEKYMPRYQAIIESFQSTFTLVTLQNDEALIFKSRNEFQKIKSE